MTLTKAFSRLQKADLNLEQLFTPREIAEILWLAVHLDDDSSQEIEAAPESPSQSNQQTSFSQSESPTTSTDETETNQNTNQSSQSDTDNDKQESTIPVYLPPNEREESPSSPKPKEQNSPAELSIKVPLAISLRNSLLLGRALRPLMVKVPSEREQNLDEKDTAKRIAEERIVIPVVKPKPERWLELAIVVEQTPSTYIWQSTINEWQQKLKYHGAFRDVRLWGLSKKDGDFELFGHQGKGKYSQTPHSLKELIDSRGRRLILLISDCISDSWRKGEIQSSIQLWAKKGLLTIVQLLPERLWHRTAFQTYSAVELKSYQRINSNSDLKKVKYEEIDEEWEEEELLDDIFTQFDNLIPIPVVTLQPKSLSSWAKVISGYGNVATTGFVFTPLSSVEVPLVKEDLGGSNISSEKQLSAEELVNRFRATASPLARRLAVLMSAMPVNIAVVHLIQATLVPESEQIHLAEVFMSGILKPVTKNIPFSGVSSSFSSSSFINEQYGYYLEEYEFVPGVREILLNSLPKNENKLILRKVSEFIANKLGLAVRDFEARLCSPWWEDDNVNILRRFAEIKSEALSRLGGEYQDFVALYETLKNQDLPVEDFVVNVTTIEKTEKQSSAIAELLETFETFKFEDNIATIVFENGKKLKTILLVEDRSEIIEDISKLLSSPYGITVTGTDDVNEVIQLAESSEIDLILINYDLPNSHYQGKIVNGIEIIADYLRDKENPNISISPYLPIIGFSVLVDREREFLRYADGFYDKNKALNDGAEQDFINYLTKIFNRVKLLELLPYESADDLDSVLDLYTERHLESRDTSEEDVSSLWNKPKGDDGTFYLLENLCLLDVLVMTAPGKGLGTARYNLSSSYLNQNSPRLYSPPEGDKFDQRLQQLPPGQIKLLKSISQTNERKQDTSLADAASLFSTHPEGGDLATYRRLENLRLLGFLSITDVGKSRETIRYNLSQKYQEYLGLEKVLELQAFEFQTVTVNRKGETIKTETHTASYFTEILLNNVDLDMVAIAGGTFIMGSREREKGHRNSESPQHQVTVSDFFMGKYPITQAQWRAIASRSDLKVKIDLDPDPSEFKGDNRPIETINWYEAVEFCQRLSRLTGRDYRLPSEAEWEYACRAVLIDHSSIDSDDLTVEEWNQKYHKPFYFGETITGDLANYNASSTYADEPKGKNTNETNPVGQFSPNANGLYDMHGNVWEWCQDDWHDNYEDAPTDGSPWLESNEGKEERKESYAVVRGGSWFYLPNGCRSASRNYLYRDYDHILHNGFRVVCVSGRTGRMQN